MAKQYRNRKSGSQRRSSFNRQRTGTGEFFSYTFITGGNFYGIKLGNSIDDFVNFDQNTTSTPEVIINGTTAIIDYSSSEVKKDLNYLNVIFDSLVSGNTFTITNGAYYDPNTQQYADISGTYTYENKFADLVIKATFDSVTNAPTGMLRYSSEYFSDTPQIDLLGTASAGTTQYFLKNYLGPEASPSFTSIDAKKDDYIFISDSITNNKKFKIDDFYLDPNGTEVLILGATSAVEEDRIGTTSEIKLYRDTTSEGALSNVKIETIKVKVGKENNSYYFIINDVKQPTLNLVRGITYIIDQTDPSNFNGPNNKKLPLRISKVRDGIFNTTITPSRDGIYYNEGVVYPQTESNIFILEPRFIPDSYIYYFCGSQSGMGGEFKLDGVYSIYDIKIAGPASVSPQNMGTPIDQSETLITSNQISANVIQRTTMSSSRSTSY